MITTKTASPRPQWATTIRPPRRLNAISARTRTQFHLSYPQPCLSRILVINYKFCGNRGIQTMLIRPALVNSHRSRSSASIMKMMAIAAWVQDKGVAPQWQSMIQMRRSQCCRRKRTRQIQSKSWPRFRPFSSSWDRLTIRATMMGTIRDSRSVFPNAFQINVWGFGVLGFWGFRV